MKYCPDCGKQLKDWVNEGNIIKKCDCGFIDWDNWVNISAVVVCFNDKNEFFMVNLKGKEEGKITFPGGYRNLNESIEEAAIRECYEETGFSITNLELFKVYTRDDIRLVWIAYKAKIKNGTFNENNETSGGSFYSINNLPSEKDLRGNLTKKLYNDVLSSLLQQRAKK